MALKQNQKAKIRVLCIIANDAKIEKNHYVSPGINYMSREADAIEWAEKHLPTTKVLWAFGAGTAPECSSGPTYASICEASLRRSLPSAQTKTNTSQSYYWGTYEEMLWIVSELEKIHFISSVEFIFFTQRQHMARVQLVWQLFFKAKWGKARFVTTSHAPGHELQKSKEWKKRIYYRAMYYSGGLLRPKHLDSDWIKLYE